MISIRYLSKNNIFLCLLALSVHVNLFGQTKVGKSQYERAILFQRINTDSALVFIDSAMSLVAKSSNLNWKATVLLEKAQIHFYRGEIDLTVENGLQAHSLFYDLKNKAFMCKANLLLSQAYSNIKHREKAEKCLVEVEKYAKAHKDKKLLIEVLNCKGNNSFQFGENERAMYYYREAEKQVAPINDLYLKCKIQNNIGNILVNMSRPAEALPIYKNILAQYKKLNQPLDELLVLYNIGRQFRAAMLLDSSLYYCQLCLDLGKKIHSLEDITYAYSGFEVTYSLMGDYKSALQNNELKHIYKDSLAFSANNMLVTRLETDYELRLNGELIKRQEQKLLRSKRRAKASVLALIILTTLLVLIVVYYVRSRKLNRALKKSNVDISKQNQIIDLALRDKETLLKEVHHRVKNSLQIVSSLLNLQESQLTDEVAIEALRNSKTRIQTIGLMHQSLYQKDADLGKVNSSNYLQNILNLQLQALSCKAIHLETVTDFVDQELSIDQAVPLGLIASELISNALKHAYIHSDSPTLFVSTNLLEEKLQLKIADNGIGFETEDFRNHSSLGLEIVEALNNQLHGEMTFVSNSDGTSFTFLFSLE